MQENYLIHILGRQEVDGEKDEICLDTVGTYCQRDGHQYISYREYYDEVVEGMRAAVTGSTGSATCRMVGTILPGVEACGKTGTAQNRGKDHSVFMGFAPMNDPKIAIAVYVENGGFGATYGVPIGAMMMDQYLHGKLSPENEIRAEEFSNRVILYGDEER